MLLMIIASLTACGGRRAQAASGEEKNFAEEGGQLSEDAAFEAPGGDFGNPDNAVSIEYEIGDIILADGSAVKEAELTAIDSRNLPAAVIAGFQEDGTAWGIGVHKSSSPLPWAMEGTAGYTTRFADLVCTQNSGDPGKDIADAFAGDLDGSDNWDMICARDQKGTANAEENYPAYNFVNTYAENYSLTGSYASGWYMPSIQQLCIIYQNREAVNASLQKIYRMDPSASMSDLGTNWYWSSSQASAEDDYLWFVHFFNGYAGECPKNFTNLHVLAVRKF